MKKMQSDARASRRAFLSQSLAATAALLGGRRSRADQTSPNERLGLAVIGTGGMGSYHLDWFRQQDDVQVIAVCDVDRGHREQARAKAGPDCRAYRDYREVLELPQVDAVLIATPDHWHGLVAVAAARAGKHIYCEKPLTNSVGEGRAVCNAVKQAGVVLQTGSHERSSPGAHVARQLIADGRLGEIKHVSIHLPMVEPHLRSVAELASPPPSMPVPDGFDFDFWLGHTPPAPYTEKRCHFWWRFHSAYGGGEMTDRGAHVIDLAQMILNLDDTGPKSIEARGTAAAGGFFDAFIKFEFQNQYGNGLRMTGDNTGPRGARFHGSEGSLLVEVHGARLTADPPALLEGVTVPEAVPYDPHRRNFLDAVRHGTPVVAPAEAGHRTATICHLNNLALRLGRGFRWDPVVERTDDPQANDLLLPKMRVPWSGLL